MTSDHNIIYLSTKRTTENNSILFTYYGSIRAFTLKIREKEEIYYGNEKKHIDVLLMIWAILLFFFIAVR